MWTLIRPGCAATDREKMAILSKIAINRSDWPMTRPPTRQCTGELLKPRTAMVLGTSQTTCSTTTGRCPLRPLEEAAQHD